MLIVDDLHVSYGRVPAVRGVSVEVERGEIVCIVGPNGAGKSTTLRTIAGAQTLAQEMSLPFLGTLPIHMELRANCDEGQPLKNWQVNEQLGEELDRICKNVASQVSIASMSGKFVQPTLSVR